MKTLKELLSQDMSKKSKPELIKILTGLDKVLTPEVYEKVSGIAPDELAKLDKKEILEEISLFKSKYDPKWENTLATASNESIRLVLGKLADESMFRTADASTAEFAAELGSIDFAKIIGGPLDACVTAQSNASVSTVSFINQVGFETDADGNKKLRMAEFIYKKNIPNPDFNKDEPEGTDNPKTIEDDVEIKVPFIALLNVPSFRIESCDIDFNVKLNSTFTQNTSSEFGLTSSVGGNVGSIFAKVNFKVEVSAKRTSSTGIKVEKEYSLGIKVRATNDEMPSGLEKVLGLLSA